MTSGIVKHHDLAPSDTLTFVVGLSCRNLRGFIFMWTYLLTFMWATKQAKGCKASLPGISGPFAIIMVSYWESQNDLLAFAGSKMHKKWMRHIYKYPKSLNLFNETYRAPVQASSINDPRGYFSTLENG